MKYRDKYKDKYWFPVKADKDYIDQVRKDYPEDTKNLSDEQVLEEYNEDGGKYITLWDHVGDAYDDFEGLADAFFELLDVVDEEKESQLFQARYYDD